MSAKISHELTYFLHIPKTAGTSLYQFLSSLFESNQTTEPVLWDNLLQGTVTFNQNTRLITGHMGGLFPFWLGSWPRIITTLREPLARALSHINHIQRKPEHPLHSLALGMSIEEYCEHPQLRKTVSNLQSRYLASVQLSSVLMKQRPDRLKPHGTISCAFEDSLFSLDADTDLLASAKHAIDDVQAVGLCEDMPRTQKLFAKVLDREGRESDMREIHNRADEGQKTVEMLTASERKRLSDLTAIDAELYEHGKSVFRSLCQLHNIA